MSHLLSKCCGKNITLRNSCWGASRVQGFNHGIVFSSEPLKYDEVFEVGGSVVTVFDLNIAYFVINLKIRNSPLLHFSYFLKLCLTKSTM